MQIHELTFAMQKDRERELCRVLTLRRHLSERPRPESSGVLGRLRSVLRRPRTAAPARTDPTCV